MMIGESNGFAFFLPRWKAIAACRCRYSCRSLFATKGSSTKERCQRSHAAKVLKLVDGSGSQIKTDAIVYRSAVKQAMIPKITPGELAMRMGLSFFFMP